MLRALFLVLLLAHPALAQEPAWPSEFVSIIEEDRTMCPGEFSIAPEAVVQRDLNGDGTLDWVLDTAGLPALTVTGCSAEPKAAASKP